MNDHTGTATQDDKTEIESDWQTTEEALNKNTPKDSPLVANERGAQVPSGAGADSHHQESGESIGVPATEQGKRTITSRKRNPASESPLPSDRASNKKHKTAPDGSDLVVEENPAKMRRPPHRVPWEDRIEMFRAYKAEHGDLLIPIRYKLNPGLGKFVHNMREQYKLFHNQRPTHYQKKCSLTNERIAELESLGFVWSTERSKQQIKDWDEKFDQLQQYKEKHGHCFVPHGYKDDPTFAEWIHRQRTTYASLKKNSKPNALVEGRIERLKALGFNFTVHTDKWMVYWNILKEYREKNGHSNVPTHFPDNPALGRWVHTQRFQRRQQEKGKKSSITADRIAQLDLLDFRWSMRLPSAEQTKKVYWQDQYEKLKTFVEAHKHFHITDPDLYAWCQEQKQRLVLQRNGAVSSKKADRLQEKHMKALEAIGFTADTTLGTLEKASTESKQDEKSQGAIT